MQRIIVPIVALFAIQNVYSQERNAQIEEVEIQGKFLNTPYKKVIENVRVISKKELEASPANSVDEALQQISGLDIRRRGSNGVQSDVSIRGGSFEQVLILINGIRLNDSQTGHNSMNIPVDLSNVERIEIFKGPAARKFGNNAYGGVINIITKTSADERVKVSAQGGDFSTYDLGLGATFGNDKISNLFQVNSGASEGYRHNNDYKIRNAFYQNSMKLNNGSLGLMAGFSEKKFGANGFYASPKATEQYEETQASIVAINHEQKFGNVQLRSNVYWRRGQDMYVYLRNKPEVYRNMHIGNNIGASINANITTTLGVTGIGTELRKEILVSNNLGNRDRFVTQVFVEQHFSWLDNKLHVSPGVSWANYSNAGDFFYPGLDVGYDFDASNKIYANISKVNRIPTFTDLYYKSKTELGNDNLKPEEALSYEVGYRYLKNNFEAKASVFGRHTDNGIDWIKDTEDALWQAENVGKMDLKGAELEIRQNLDGVVKSYVLSYTYIDNKIDKAAAFSKYALDNLKHQLIAKVDVALLKNLTNQLSYLIHCIYC